MPDPARADAEQLRRSRGPPYSRADQNLPPSVEPCAYAHACNGKGYCTGRLTIRKTSATALARSVRRLIVSCLRALPLQPRPTTRSARTMPGITTPATTSPTATRAPRAAVTGRACSRRRRRRSNRSRARSSTTRPLCARNLVVSTSERRLYFVLPNGEAIRYGVGVGRPGFTWSGVKTVRPSREWPQLDAAGRDARRRPDLPRYMAGGIENPLGARAMYHRQHRVPHPRLERARYDRPGRLSGCIRMTNDDVPTSTSASRSAPRSSCSADRPRRSLRCRRGRVVRGGGAAPAHFGA